jgi:hypothetical protein
MCRERVFLWYIFPMASNNDDLLKETYKLTRENNRMIHAMRRNAFIGGIIKIVIYAALIGVPIWLLVTYVYPILNTAVGTLNQVQGQVQQVQGAGSAGINNLLEQVKNIPGIGNFGE